MDNDKKCTCTINNFVKDIHKNACDKGFHDKIQTFAHLAMLVVTELSEAVEADRTNKRAMLEKFYESTNRNIGKIRTDVSEKHQEYFIKESYNTAFEKYIRGTVEEEIADTIIRLFDICGLLQIDIEEFIKIKMIYNQSRPPLHNKKY